MPRPYDLPAMTSLLCFEASARHLSFKRAAAELNVTPTAISHQIRQLERELGRKLFHRGHRGVDLTEVGAYLFVAVQRGLESMSETVRDIRSRGEHEDVVVGVTTAMSALWLTPQITAFWSDHPEVVISQSVSDVASSAERRDLSVLYGPLPEADKTCRILFRDGILALGSPDFAERHGITCAADLLRAPLIHLVTSEHRWTGWPDWFAALDLGAPTGRRVNVNNYMIALQLAQDGVGAVLGWDGLVMPLLARSQLARLVDDRITSPFPFYVKLHSDASADARTFHGWLVNRFMPQDVFPGDTAS